MGVWFSLICSTSSPNLYWWVLCSCQTSPQLFQLLLVGATVQPCLVHSKTQLSCGSVGTAISSARPTLTLALLSASGCWSLAQYSTPTDPVHTHATGCSAQSVLVPVSWTHQWEPQSTSRVLLARLPDPLSVTDLVHANSCSNSA